MPQVVLHDKSNRAVLGVADDGLSAHLFDDTRQRVPMVVANGRLTGQTGAIASLLSYTVPHNGDHSFKVGANVLVTTATTHAFTLTVTYTDEGGVSRTVTLSFTLVAGGALVTSIANGNGVVPYEGVPLQIRAKAGTAITVATTGTFTSVVYNADASLSLVA